MTRSVYATLGGGGPAKKPPVSGGSRSRNESSTNSSTNESGGGTSSVGGGSLQAKLASTGSKTSTVAQRKSLPKQQPSMTQSLYEPLPSKRSSRATPGLSLTIHLENFLILFEIRQLIIFVFVKTLKMSKVIREVIKVVHLL